MSAGSDKGWSTEQVLTEARAVIEAEANAVRGLGERIDGGFTAAVRLVAACQGRVVVTGLGKSGLVGQKISATLASTGTPSLFLHAAEAAHGDLGRITEDDVVLALSNSGESEEVVRLLRPVKGLGAKLVALTGDEDSTLSRHADVVITIGNIAEACPMGLVPTASTTAMMVVGDALAMVLFKMHGFGSEEYARFHPGGQLGRKLMKVEEVMRSGDENPVCLQDAPLRHVIAMMTETAGRPGAASVVDADGKLVGFFTDGDLRRHLKDPAFSVDVPVSAVMHAEPKRVEVGHLVAEAVHILRQHQIDQVPVVDEQGVPVGLLDVQDLLRTKVL